MSTMQAELYDALIAAGAPENKAKAAAEAITSYRKTDEVATKADIAELRTDMAKLEGRLTDKLTWRMIICMGITIAVLGLIIKT